MRAIRVHEFGGPGVMRLEDVPAPEPGPGQVVVRMRCCGVNPVDTYIRSGTYTFRPPLPYTPGWDGAGVVERAGAETPWAPGDRVYVCRAASGSYAELALCDASQVRRLPERVSFEQGAGVWIPYATAYRGLVHKARLRAGEWVLVHGASGGVGTAALQIGAAMGARLIGTAGTAEGLEHVRRHGAELALDHTAPGYLDEVRRVTGHPAGGVGVVLEMLANVNLDRDLSVLAMGGRVVVIGSRGAVEVTPRQLMSRDSMVVGLSLPNASPAEADEIGAALHAGLSNGTLSPVVGAVLPLGAAPEAHERVLSRGARGKVVLAV